MSEGETGGREGGRGEMKGKTNKDWWRDGSGEGGDNLEGLS